MNTHKISVIVPVYKVEPYLDRCVKSIINQTYKNLEIIIIDDGSPDRCPQMCDEWAKKDKRIVVIHKPNGGISDARNVGIDNATGDYIAFVDSDDFVVDNFIETLYNLCIEHECDIAQCDFAHAHNDDIIPCMKESNVRVLSNIEMLHSFYNELYLPTSVVWDKLYKKHLFENIRFQIGVRYEDELILPAIIYNANRVAVIYKKMYMYYQHKDSFINSGFDRRRLGIVNVLYDRIRFFDDKGLKELKKKSIENYCMKSIERYRQCQAYIPDCKDVLKELISKYRSVYMSALFQNNISWPLKIRFIIHGFLPNLPVWLGRKYPA